MSRSPSPRIVRDFSTPRVGQSRNLNVHARNYQANSKVNIKSPRHGYQTSPSYQLGRPFFRPSSVSPRSRRPGRRFARSAERLERPLSPPDSRGRYPFSRKRTVASITNETHDQWMDDPAEEVDPNNEEPVIPPLNDENPIDREEVEEGGDSGPENEVFIGPDPQPEGQREVENLLEEQIERIRVEEEDEEVENQVPEVNMASQATVDYLKAKYPQDHSDSEDEPLDPAATLDIQYIVLKRRQHRAKEKARDKQQALLTEAMTKLSASAGRTSQKDTPKFHGKAEESAAAHLLTVEDWRLKEGITDEHIAERFKETLRDEGRIWYNENKKLSWTEMRASFICQFDQDGKSMRQLKSDWYTDKFSPHREDIKTFLRRFNLTAELIGVSEETVVDQIKNAMPTELMGALFDRTDKVRIEKFLVEYYKSQAAAKAKEKSTVAAAANPFARLYAFNPQDFPHYAPMYHRNMGQIAVPGEKPFRPRVYQPQPRYRTQHYENNSQGNYQPQRQRPPDRNQNWRGKQRREQEKGAPVRKQYDRRNPPKFIGAKPRVPKIRDSNVDRQKRLDKQRCHHCKEIGHWKNECPWLKLQDNLHKQPPYGITKKGEDEGASEQVHYLQEQLAFAQIQDAALFAEMADENQQENM